MKQTKASNEAMNQVKQTLYMYPEIKSARLNGSVKQSALYLDYSNYLDMLNQPERALIRRRFFNGESIQELANAMSCSIATVSRTITRIINKIALNVEMENK